MKEFDTLNLKPRHVFCKDGTNGLDDCGGTFLVTGMIYHLMDVIGKNNCTLVQLKECPKSCFYSNRFAEVEYSEKYSDFNIYNPSMRHVACVNNQDQNWSLGDNASKKLIVGEIYHVSAVEVHDWHTRVCLIEFGNMQFNSTSFSEVRIPKQKES